MRLRRRIFRQFLAVALIPSCIIAVAAWYLLDRGIDQATRQLAPQTPDRTINSLRLSEARLQQAVEAYLMHAVDPTSDSLLDWQVVIDGGKTISVYSKSSRTFRIDSVLRAATVHPGPIRHLEQNGLIIGAAVERSGKIVAGGFIFDAEYLSGFDAAASSLSQSRNFQNMMPGFVFFIAAAGAVIVIIVIAAALFFSGRLARSVTMPLERLTDITAAVARGTRPEIESIAGSDEIVRLTDSFQQMMADLDQSRSRLIAAERVAAWQEFARRLAHELKNPLTPIALSLYRIEKRLQESGRFDDFKEPFEAIKAEVEHLQRMAADYSSLAHLPEPKAIFFDFGRVVRDVTALYAAQMEPFQVDIRIAEPSLEISGDPDRLREVMVNIIKNALEFTPVSGRISIAAGREGTAVYFAVTNDNKDGALSDAALRQATRPYFTTRPGGTGLGLAIAEKIIIDHKGQLMLHADDSRTEVRFEIPATTISGDNL